MYKCVYRSNDDKYLTCLFVEIKMNKIFRVVTTGKATTGEYI